MGFEPILLTSRQLATHPTDLPHVDVGRDEPLGGRVCQRRLEVGLGVRDIVSQHAHVLAAADSTSSSDGAA